MPLTSSSSSSSSSQVSGGRNAPLVLFSDDCNDDESESEENENENENEPSPKRSKKNLAREGNLQVIKQGLLTKKLLPNVTGTNM